MLKPGKVVAGIAVGRIALVSALPNVAPLRVRQRPNPPLSPLGHSEAQAEESQMPALTKSCPSC